MTKSLLAARVARATGAERAKLYAEARDSLDGRKTARDFHVCAVCGLTTTKSELRTVRVVLQFEVSVRQRRPAGRSGSRPPATPEASISTAGGRIRAVKRSEVRSSVHQQREPECPD